MKTPTIQEKDVVSAAAESHRFGAGIGALGGTVAGAALGAFFGPLGALTGAVLGGAFGIIAGMGIAEGIEPETEQAYWERHFQDEPYYETRYAFADYGPAYRLGWQLYSPGAEFEKVEKIMEEQWGEDKGSSKLHWDKAREAAKASWRRAEQSRPSSWT